MLIGPRGRSRSLIVVSILLLLQVQSGERVGAVVVLHEAPRRGAGLFCWGTLYLWGVSQRSAASDRAYVWGRARAGEAGFHWYSRCAKCMRLRPGALPGDVQMRESPRPTGNRGAECH